MNSEVVGEASQILERTDPRTQVVGIDEANFLGPALIDVAERLADGGKQVIIAGLDTDYMGRPFAPLPELLCARNRSPRRWPYACAAAIRPSTRNGFMRATI